MSNECVLHSLLFINPIDVKVNILIYVAANFLLVHFTNLDNYVANVILNSLCVLGIITLGIAHGSIDNVLYGAKAGRSNIFFIVKYVTVISLFAALWFLVPNIAFAIFIGVSCYHFGQSQHTEYFSENSTLSKVLFFAWGGLVIVMMLAFNSEELLTSQAESFEFYPFLSHLVSYSIFYLIVFGIVYFAIQIYLLNARQIALSDFLKEVYILVLLSISLFIFPAFVAFSLFFVFVHSMKVIMQEYEYCKDTKQVKNTRQFVALFLPLASISIVFTLLVMGILVYLDKVEYMSYVLLILLSCVTIPHSFVMEKFYDRLLLRS